MAKLPFFAGESAAVRVIILALTVLWLISPALRPLTHPDEGRYAEIPREILATGEWITPHLNALPYVEKPPLQYWASAIGMQIFGISEWSARLWPALTACLMMFVTYALGSRLWGRQCGLMALALLASSALVIAMGQTLTLDMSFSAFMTAVLGSFCMAQLHRITPAIQRRWMLLCWISLSLAVMTKGIVAPVIAGGTLTLYVIWQRDWLVLRHLSLGWGLAVFLLICTPWFVLAARADNDFLNFFFIHEHLQRYLTRSADRYEPWWYFIVVAAISVLPWIVPALQSLATGWRSTQSRGEFDAGRLLWVWIMFTLVFFSLSDSKLAPYILPMMPAWALLGAHALLRAPRRAVRIAAACAALTAVALLIALVVVARLSPAPDWMSAVPDFQIYLVFAAVVLLAGAATVLRRPESGVPQLWICCAWLIATLTVLFGGWHSETLRSGKALAAQVAPQLAADTPLYSVETYDQTLPFYLRRTMTLVNFRNELDYGLRQLPQLGIAHTGDFIARWRELDRGVAIMSNSTFDQLVAADVPMRVIARDRRRIAVSRR
jgi:4-amino-4-deoxy-L-arabinose transferase-like glycosyltransferase